MAILATFLRLLVRPGATVERLVAQSPSFTTIAIWVGVVGLVRWAIECLWILLMAGQLQTLIASGVTSTWYVEAVPFLLANFLTVGFRWGLFALVPYALGRFAEGRGEWRDFLRVYGVAMGIYVVTILPNFAYFYWDFPAIRFEVSRLYTPLFGIGQILTSIWLVVLGYATARRLHGLPPFESVLVGIAVPTSNVALYVIASGVFFNLPPLLMRGRTELFWIAGLAFGSVVLVAIPVLFWCGFHVARTETTRRASAQHLGGS